MQYEWNKTAFFTAQVMDRDWQSRNLRQKQVRLPLKAGQEQTGSITGGQARRKQTLELLACRRAQSGAE